MPSIGGDHLAVVDSRTGATYKIPVEHNSISAASLAQIKAKGSRRVDNVHVGLRVYDNGYNHTAVMKSKVTFVYVTSTPTFTYTAQASNAHA